MNNRNLKFQEYYTKISLPQLKEKLALENIMALPKVHHVIVSAGVGKHAKEGKFMEDVEKGLLALTGQKPVKTLARKSIAGFKLREGQIAGLMVTLRGQKMNDFLQKFINITLPRVRDFRGVTASSIDQGGNLSVGIKEAQAFPEVDPQKIETIFGLQVTIVTTAKNKEESKVLFESLGFPLTESQVEDIKLFGPQKKAAKGKKS